MSSLLGIDVGTTNIKVIAFDEEGRGLAGASRPTPTEHQGPGRAVHQAEVLWQLVAELIREVAGGLGASRRPDALAMASMGEEGFPLDSQGQPLYPGILWYDERTLGLVSWWTEHVGREAVYRITGLPVQHILTALKLQWLATEEPEVMARAARWLWVGDYITFRLTGEQVTTPSMASRTMLYDLTSGCWSRELVDAAALAPDLLPPIVQSGTLIGTVSAEAARFTGLPPGTPVAAGGHDHICGCLASGAIRPGDVLHSAGTAESFTHILPPSALQELLSRPGEVARGAHVLPGLYYTAALRYSGGVVGWWERLLGPNGSSGSAEGSPPGANGLVFVPYMFGKEAPDPDPGAAGGLVGLTADHTPGDVMRAVLEGVCFDSVEAHDAVTGANGIGGRKGAVTAIGGLTQNPLWLQLKASILGVEVRAAEQPEAVAQGAALLAGLGAGAYRDPEEAVRRTLRFSRTVRPKPEEALRYRDLYEGVYLPAARSVRAAARRGAQ